MKRFIAFLLLASAIATASEAQLTYKEIKSVDPIVVTTSEGTAPRLPFQLKVTYADGTSELRGVRWTNAAPATEQAQADAKQTPAGTAYDVRGYVTGDNTTTMGYPVIAHVSVVSTPYATPSNKPVAEPLPLNRVSINGQNRLTHNRDMDVDQLLSLDVRQQLYNYRDTYGLPTDGYPEADGWDSPTTKLKGHGSGHYMSAMAMAYASCTDQAKRQRLKENLRVMVDELRACQERTFVYDKALGRYREARDLAPEDELRQLKGTWADFDRYKQDYAHYGYGYLNAIPAQHCVLIEMYRAYNNEQWVWAPYYSVHKQLAGLIDIANYIDDKAIARKALLIAKDMGLWVWNRLHYRTFVQEQGSQEERRQRPGNRFEMWNMYIAGEVGGMAESLARLSEMVRDKDERAHLLEAATYFDSPAFFTPLSKNVDAIRTRHANQHIPMVTGALRAYRGNANPYYYNLAQNFWTMIQGRYRYAMGGVGNGEMFRQPYTQILSMCTNVGTDWRDRSTYPEPTLNETCCAYNLAKLTKDLNCFRPNDASYMDYYERVLYNQIIGSLNPRHYAVLYQYAVGLDASKPWGNETPQSTCCGGTGVENHVKYQEAAYFVGADTLWVALYLPTTAEWEAKKATIQQECEWPAERSVIRFAKAKKPFAVKLRVPYWATEGFDIRVNGQSVATHYQPSSYVTLPLRRWTATDRIEIVMPFADHLDFGPDKMEVAATGKNEPRTRFEPAWCAALMHGPLVMAAEGIKTWEQATIAMDNGPLNTDNGLGEKVNGKWKMVDGKWLPDYDADRHVTHYFRLRLPGTPVAAVAEGEGGADVDDTRLKEALQLARSRRDAQNAWNQLTVKVPEYAPWAKHGYARLMEQFDRARALFDDAERSHSQEAIDAMTTELNAALNTMRPGNLPELEDLDALLPLLAKARQQQAPSPKLREAIDYAEMVVKYVSDGSGTADMIERAERQLRDAAK
ncbi:MAG: glycoside hydrolase family 127 protein [Bacteroidaceae bacterium]|nr:glycoside hydrolase family 127 protein [Bacteroidaceae bacterium]